MPDSPAPDWLALATACGVGLLIGFERERRKGNGAGRRAAGIRTFLMSAVLGFAAMEVGGGLAVAACVVAIGTLLAAAYRQRQGGDPGITTEVTLMLASVLGALTVVSPAMSLAIGAMTAMALAYRSRMHDFVRSTVTETELRDGLAFATATLVVLPLLPDRFMGPLNAINPRTAWSFVALVMAIGMLSHLARRLIAPALGLLVSGFASGFASGIATVSAMAELARSHPELARAAAAGAVLSCLSTVIQLAMVLAVVNTATLLAMTPALLAAGLVALGYAGVVGMKVLLQPVALEPQGEEHAFRFRNALVLGILVSGMTLLSSQLQAWFGSAGVTVGAAVAGLADAHASAASVAALVQSGKLTSTEAVIPVLAGFSTNALIKLLVASVAGGGRFALMIGGGLVLQLAAAWLVAYESWL